MHSTTSLEILQNFPAKTIFCFLQGEFGALESIINIADKITPQTEAYVAIVCHPHPLHGGTMHNKVVHTAAKALNDIGISTIRFNYRGIGKSLGSYDNGIGETLDLEHILDWVAQVKPNAKLILVGFSFGSFIATKASQTKPCQLLITIAPAITNQDYQPIIPTDPSLTWLIIHGDQDELIPIGRIITWHAALPLQPELQIIKNASHFFHGCLITLKQVIQQFTQQHLI